MNATKYRQKTRKKRVTPYLHFVLFLSTDKIKGQLLDKFEVIKEFYKFSEGLRNQKTEILKDFEFLESIPKEYYYFFTLERKGKKELNPKKAKYCNKKVDYLYFSLSKKSIPVR